MTIGLVDTRWDPPLIPIPFVASVVPYLLVSHPIKKIEVACTCYGFDISIQSADTSIKKKGAARTQKRELGLARM